MESGERGSCPGLIGDTVYPSLFFGGLLVGVINLVGVFCRLLDSVFDRGGVVNLGESTIVLSTKGRGDSEFILSCLLGGTYGST